MHVPKAYLAMFVALFLIVVAGVAGYSIYRVNRLESMVASNVQASQAAQLPVPTTFTLYGNAKSIGDNSLLLTNQNGDTEVNIDSGTRIVLSTPISPQAYSNDIQKYDSELAQLQSENDQAAIKALAFPSGVTTQPIQLSDLAAGDSLVVTCVAPQVDATCEAQQIMKSQISATSIPPTQ
jgi:hypothetical protein